MKWEELYRQRMFVSGSSNVKGIAIDVRREVEVLPDPTRGVVHIHVSYCFCILILFLNLNLKVQINSDMGYLSPYGYQVLVSMVR